MTAETDKYPQHTTWQLARLADCADPDKPDGLAWPYVDGDEERARMNADASPGAQFLRRVEDNVLEWFDNEQSGDFDDYAGELADNAVPVYTHERWRVFVDLAAYDEDISELGSDSSDLTEAAGVALYLIAERLARALHDEYAEADEDDEDDDETTA